MGQAAQPAADRPVRIFPSIKLLTIVQRAFIVLILIDMKLPRLVLLIATMVPLALAQKISLEFDEAQDFSDYKTFAIVKGNLNSKNPSLNNEIVQKNLDADIRKYFTARGLTEATGKPDLNIRYVLGSGRRVETEAYPAGWRGLGTRVVRRAYAEGTLTIDLRDANKHTLVWRAIAVEENSDPMKIKDHLSDMVRKSAEKYPPKK